MWMRAAPGQMLQQCLLDKTIYILPASGSSNTKFSLQWFFIVKKLSNFNTILAFGQALSEILPLILILQFLHNGACQSVSLGVGKEIISQDLTHFVLIAGEYQLSVDT